jgi:hypothetical protein
VGVCGEHRRVVTSSMHDGLVGASPRGFNVTVVPTHLGVVIYFSL